MTRPLVTADLMNWSGCHYPAAPPVSQAQIDATLAELARRIRRAVAEHAEADQPNKAALFATLADYVESAG